MVVVKTYVRFQTKTIGVYLPVLATIFVGYCVLLCAIGAPSTTKQVQVSTVVRQPGGNRHRIPPATCFRVRRRETVRSVAPAQSDLQHILLEIRLQRAKTRQDTSTTILKSFSLYIVHCSYVSSTSYSLSSPSSPSTDAKFVNSPSSDASKLRFVPWGRAAIFVPRVRALVVSA